MALNGLFCADVPLRNYSLTKSFLSHKVLICISFALSQTLVYTARPRILGLVHRVVCWYSLRLSMQAWPYTVSCIYWARRSITLLTDQHVALHLVHRGWANKVSCKRPCRYSYLHQTLADFQNSFTGQSVEN